MLAGSVNGSCWDTVTPAARPASEIAPGDTRISDAFNVASVDRYICDSALSGARPVAALVTLKAKVPPAPATRLELTSEAADTIKFAGDTGGGGVAAASTIIWVVPVADAPEESTATT